MVDRAVDARDGAAVVRVDADQIADGAGQRGGRDRATQVQGEARDLLRVVARVRGRVVELDDDEAVLERDDRVAGRVAVACAGHARERVALDRGCDRGRVGPGFTW